MSTYTPDKWAIIQIESPGHELYHRIIAGWYGGFTGGDSWKLSSGITKSIDRGTHYEIHNHSGSIYNCAKGAEGLSSYMMSVYMSYKKEMNAEGVIFDIVDEVPLLVSNI